ncbi:lantibiotic immunity ABC transporter MutE/EpiE family permease subunit [Anaerocolumna xylanovorans]|uniref:ABC-2 type transport system permease protein n=1 Tax=Anaerocolumna xylanovorans DSM 12503 TaxID=1121345 RepID=A0A1M7Y5D3_9FIRM|nr:lantibiotic immunity ABC transporter MutE/EpiE family permease subunit [Anaerocolumna xylanovorans]SHO47660.1 ABC-2 type transport system permease protein [Anaerocolumna xylanovorans DSM 12503]
MADYFKAELLKQKHSFNNIIIWLIPVINIIISMILMGPQFIQTASYNWWYVLFLPFTFTYISASIIKKERKYNFHGLFGITQNKMQLWLVKVGTATVYLFLSCLIFSLFTLLCGVTINQQIPVINNLAASAVLFLTFAWQIPFLMFITLKLNMFISVIVSIFCSLFLACIYGAGSWWWIPFAIPVRLMCPIIKVLPNGLLMEADSPLGHSNVILPGIIITVILYLAVTAVTAKLFEKQEV